VDAEEALHSRILKRIGGSPPITAIANFAMCCSRWLECNPPEQAMQVHVLLRARAIARRDHLIFHQKLQAGAPLIIAPYTISKILHLRSRQRKNVP
jgi:hypothetical protein